MGAIGVYVGFVNYPMLAGTSAGALIPGRGTQGNTGEGQGGNTGTSYGEYLTGKAPTQVSPGIRYLEGQYINDLGEIQPWKAYYDEFGRLIARTDYNAGNIAQKIPDVHYHLYEWGAGKTPYEYGSHIEGEYMP